MSGTFVVREARHADLPACIRLLAEDVLGAGREEVGEAIDPRYASAFDELENDPRMTLLVGELDGRVVAVAQLMLLRHLAQIGQLRAQIEGVRVAADLRGQGLGALLMRDAIERARGLGATLVQLTTNAERTRAREFYERLGFVPSHVGMKLAL